MTIRAPRGLALLVALVATLSLIAACGAAAASFDPNGPCTVDGAAPGAYPELEALVPTTYEGRAPDRLDSGRNCSSENLGSLAGLGIQEVRYAGGLWNFGADRGAVLGIFTAPGLTAKAMSDFYANGARASNRTQVLKESDVTIAGRPGRRVDTQTGDRLQTIVVWPSASGDRVNAIITSDIPDPKIDAAVSAFADR
ncbi:MAG: hypothetical protein ACJ761_11890 [Chloroflexota bacterium]